MQPSAGPALPHTHSRAVHWLTTAAGLGVVIGAGALVQPAGASTGAPVAPVASAPDPKAVTYPMNCAGAPVDVLDQAVADLDGDGRAETVAVVRCHSQAGTPPSGVYVLGPGGTPGSAPRIVETLVDPKEQRSITDFRLRGHTITATVLGYSSPDTPRCCPDLKRSYSWEWRGGRFYAIPGALADSA